MNSQMAHEGVFETEAFGALDALIDLSCFRCVFVLLRVKVEIVNMGKFERAHVALCCAVSSLGTRLIAGRRFFVYRTLRYPREIILAHGQRFSLYVLHLQRRGDSSFFSFGGCFVDEAVRVLTLTLLKLWDRELMVDTRIKNIPPYRIRSLSCRKLLISNFDLKCSSQLPTYTLRVKE